MQVSGHISIHSAYVELLVRLCVYFLPSAIHESSDVYVNVCLYRLIKKISADACTLIKYMRYIVLEMCVPVVHKC